MAVPTKVNVASPKNSQVAATLSTADIPTALAICQIDPLASVIPAARLHLASEQGWKAAAGEAWGWHDGEGRLRAVAWVGANLIPIVPQELPEQHRTQAIKAFAEKAKQFGPRSSAITGLADVVLPLWRELKTKWPEPSDIRYRQPLLVLNSIVPGIAPNPEVRLTKNSEWTMLLPAATAMFTEEVGYDPQRFGAEAYQQHLKNMITEQRSYCLIVNTQVLFKADIAAVANGVALLQGIWVKPEFRGQGIAKPALTTVISQIQKHHVPTIALYVNQHNTKAINLYRSLGFKQVSTFTSVLF